MFLLNAGVVLVSVLFLALVVYAVVRMRYKKAGPDEALIVYGRRKLFGAKVRDEQGAVGEVVRAVRKALRKASGWFAAGAPSCGPRGSSRSSCRSG